MAVDFAGAGAVAFSGFLEQEDTAAAIDNRTTAPGIFMAQKICLFRSDGDYFLT
jgi:hypothetical protein